MSSYENQTFLVTGGAGFIGSHLVDALLMRHARVIAIDDFNDFYDPQIKEKNVAPFLQNQRFSLYRADIRDQQTLQEIFQHHASALRQDGGIIHLAARAGVRPSLLQPRLYMETNVTGTLNLLEMARIFNISKFIFASSSSVYGDSPENIPFVETQDVSKPISPYASTKMMCESLLHVYYRLYHLQVVILRFFTVYGEGQRPDLAIHKFTRLIDEGKVIPFYGDGSTKRDYTYISDIIQGVLSAIQYNQSNFEIFNLGESETTSLSQLVKLIEEALGKRATLDYQPQQPGDVSITYADITKAKRMLHYAPAVKIEQGIPLFARWYIKNISKTSSSC